MPELPEVETTRRGILPHCQQQTIKEVVIRNRNLRWPVATSLAAQLRQQIIKDVRRRAKYLLLVTDSGTLILHLGMSGSLRISNAHETIRKHDHVDIILSNDKILRFQRPQKIWKLALDKSTATTAQTSMRPRTRTLERTINRRLFIRHLSQAQGRNQKFYYEQPYRGRYWQYLRFRIFIPCWHPPPTRGIKYIITTLRQAGNDDTRSIKRGD